MTPNIAPLGLIFSDVPAHLLDQQSVSYNISPNVTDDSSQLDLGWTQQQIHFAHGDGERNIIQTIPWRVPALVSSLDPRYPDVTTSKQISYELESYQENPSELSYFISNDAVLVMTRRGYALLNITISANMPLFINHSATILKDKGVFFSTDQELNILLIEPQDQRLVLVIPSVPNWKLSVSLCHDIFPSIDTKVNVTSSHRTDEPILGAWNASAKSSTRTTFGANSVQT